MEVGLKNKITLAVLAALSSTAFISHGLAAMDSKVSPPNIKQSTKQSTQAFLQAAAFKFDAADKQGEHMYIVHLQDAPIALYEGGISKYSATKPNKQKLQMKSSAVNSYSSYLDEQHQTFLGHVKQKVANIKPEFTYKVAFNGMAMKVSQDNALAISQLPGVLKVVKDKIYKLDTDTGPSLVGAPNVWDGTALESGVGNFGEGVVVGIIDSGINTDHPSFADIAGDGFDHTNPLGSGVYLGDCAGDFAELCNDKLIGVYSYDAITREYSDTEVFPVDLPANGEDYDGHGSHVASTAAGNILLNVQQSFPELNAIESAGVETGLVLPRISGVAPRANIISYQVCWPGSAAEGDTYAGCTGAAINAAIEDAIQDQVDVINYSISGGDQPWNSSTELAFLSARNAGVFVATSAGNSGPDAGSTRKHAPWYTAVAASEHGRFVSYEKQLNSFSGGDSSLGALVGSSNSGSITAPIVYAGDFANPNDPNNDSAQCLEPFPANTFSGQIVVCDRGEIARIQKAVNVRDGGAGGYVLANVVGGTDNLANDQYVVPGIHIQAAQGTQLRNWLASGTGHAATITASSGELSIDAAREDVLAGFSSKGPNSSISTLTPTIGGPGVQIYAAFADQQFGHDGHEPAAGDFNFLSGTSMSSPHIAGAAALVKAVKPTWTPDNIRSALAMTASRTVKKEDGVTAADWFDSGSGRVQVDKAVEAGLVMEETAANYTAANPLQGGDARTLNIPSITDNQCINTCTWTRTLTATKTGTWSVSTQNISSDILITSNPTSFTLNEGESQTLTTTIDITAATGSDWLFGTLLLTANDQPDLHIPVSVTPGTGTIPGGIEITANRSADSLLVTDIESTNQSDFTASTLGFTKATEVNDSILQDLTPSEPFDDVQQGVALFELNVDSSYSRIVAQITESTASDVDLFIVFDANGNNIPELSEVIDSSLTNGSIEYVDTTSISTGKYWVMVQSFNDSVDGDADTYKLFYAAVDASADNLSLDFTVPSIVSAGVPFDIRANWDLADSMLNEKFYGVVSYGSPSSPDSAGVTLVNITRGEQDVELRSVSSLLNIGEGSEFEILIKGTSSPEDRNYDIKLPIPSGFSLDANSVSQGGAISNDEVNWSITKSSTDTENQVLTFSLIPESTITQEDLSFALSSDVTNIQSAQVETSVLSTTIQLDSPPTVTIDGSDVANINMVETQTISINALVEDLNGGDLTIEWRQLSGPAGTLNDADTATLSFVAPSVDTEQVAVLEITVQDPEGNTDVATANITISNNDAPTITISAPSSVTAGQSYTVSVTATDPENDNVTITINDQAGSSLTRTAPSSATTLNFNIVATDGVNQVSDSVSITVTAAPSTGGGSSSGGGGGGAMGWIVFMLLPITFVRRLVKKTKI